MNAMQLTNLALNLFTGPSSSVTCATAEVLVRTGLPGHRSQEVVAEVFPDFTILEGICQIAVHG